MTEYLDYKLVTIKEAKRIIDAYNLGDKSIKVSLDLGISMSDIFIDGENVKFSEDVVSIDELKKVKEGFCYAIEEGELKKIAFYSDETRFYYKLHPTKDWPTMMLSSTPMHRYTKISPREDTLAKINDTMPIRGKVLDTCCGLGYTAITASKYADKVFTFERDENVIYLEAINPYSRKLFTDNRIVHKHASIYDEIWPMKDESFDIIIHDPPTPKYSPQLYSKSFYEELFRVLKGGGTLYHYAPWPHKTKGENFPEIVSKNLKAVGFIVMGYKESSSGIIAKKI